MKVVKQLALLVVISFTLHFVWESLHIRFYTGYEHLSPHVPITLFATIGDVLYTMGVVVAVSLFHRSFRWISSVGFTQMIFLALIGFVIAVLVEVKGLAYHRWAYLPTMPLVPFINVGLTPVLQMTVLLPLSLFLARILGSSEQKKAGR